MGSLRNPVGPLPSTIYWRRRAVALCLVALLALIAVWVVTSGDGDGKKPNDAANGASPAPSITPGPGGTGPAISQQPGGREESEETGTTEGSGDGSGEGAGDGSGDGSGENGSGTETGGKNGDTDGAGGDGGAGTGAGQRVPAGSPLPNCPAGALQLTLSSAKISYEAGERPRFQLVATNTSGADCKADLGPRAAVLTIRDSQNDEVWSSDDCPRPGDPVLLRLPARGTVTHVVEWDRRHSAPQCATPPAGEVGPGTYLVEATVPGTTVPPASFSLAKG